MYEYPTKEEFAGQLQTPFELQLETGESLQLVMTELREGISTPRQEAFSLTFRGPELPYLAQCSYPLRHAVFGAIDIFIVPIGRDEQGINYEAVFNRFTTGG